MSSLNVLNGDGTHFLSVSEGKGLETLTRVVVENSDSWAFLWKWVFLWKEELSGAMGSFHLVPVSF